jgi:hypothetical protein
MVAVNRRRWCQCMMMGVLALGTGFVAQADEIASLSDQLKSVLRARRPVEFEFIARVVELVEQKQLPYDLVIAVMKYATGKRAQIPYPYFEQGMRIKAAELGVEI